MPRTDRGGGRRRPRATSRTRKVSEDRGPATRTRSFPCPDDLWENVKRFATERDLGSPAAAARLLLRSGLSVEMRTRELAAARDWQIENAWAELMKIEAGEATIGSWADIDRAVKLAQRRIRERERRDVKV